MKCPACHELLICSACKAEIKDSGSADFPPEGTVTSLEDINESIEKLNDKLEILKAEKIARQDLTEEIPSDDDDDDSLTVL